MKILTIIVTYNALQRDWLYKCLDSLKESSIQTDVFIVDNASTDETVKEIENKYPDVQLIKSQENLGFAKANNIGFKKVLDKNYDYAFLLNQDAWVEKDTIQKLVQAQQNNQEYGILSPIHLNGDGTNLDELFSRFLLNYPGEGRRYYFDQIQNTSLKEIYEVEFINAACWLVSKTCLKKVGLFDEVLFQHYGEDNNFINRMLFKKFKLGIIPNTYVFHDREFRKKAKTESKFNTKYRILLLEFNITGSNLYNENAVILMDKQIEKMKKESVNFLLRLNYKKHRYYSKLYKILETQKKIVLQQRKTY